MKFVFNPISFFLVSLIFTLSLSLPAIAQVKTALQKDRTAKMKILGRSMHQLNKASNIASMKAPAAAISTTTKMLINIWPKGSGGSATRAKPTIWSEMGDFKAKLLDMKIAADKLVLITDQNNFDEAKTAFYSVGKTCKECHKVFRGPKK